MGRVKFTARRTTTQKTLLTLQNDANKSTLGAPQVKRFCPSSIALHKSQSRDSCSYSFIEKRHFQKLLKQVATEVRPSYQFSPTAILATHQAAEMYLSKLFWDSRVSATLAKRVTLLRKDICLTRIMRGEIRN